MKLKRVEKKEDQDYPSFEDYWKNRMKYLSTMALGAGLAIGASMLTSCNDAGKANEPDTPKASQKAGPVENGKTANADKPTDKPTPTTCTNTGGKPKAPTSPQPTPSIKGDVVQPTPPVAQPTPPPNIRGRIAAPVKPVTVQPPRKMGKMKAPSKPQTDIIKTVVPIKREAMIEGGMRAPVPVVKKPVVPVKREAMIDGDMIMPEPPKKAEK